MFEEAWINYVEQSRIGASLLSQINSCIFNMALGCLIKKEELIRAEVAEKESFFFCPLSISGCILEGAGRAVPLFPKSSTPHPSSAAARHVPSPAQLHLNTPLLPNTWLHLPLSKWKISIICLSEYPANEGFHDKLVEVYYAKGESERSQRGTEIKDGVVKNNKKKNTLLLTWKTGLGVSFSWVQITTEKIKMKYTSRRWYWCITFKSIIIWIFK